MDESIDSRVREAISELQMYLSDALAPLVVMDSIELLLQYPAEVLAAGIHEWTVTQSRREGGSVPVSDYLYHALRKLFLIGDFRLMSKDELTNKVEELKPILLEICPPGDRELLQANFARIDEVQTGVAPPVAQLQRQFVAHAMPLASESRAVTAEDLSGSKRLSNLVQQLETVTTAATASMAATAISSHSGQAASAGAPPAAPASGPQVIVVGGSPAGSTGVSVAGTPAAAKPTKPADLVTQILVVAAGNQQDPEELRRARDYLLSRGPDASMEKIIHALAEKIPGWILPSTPAAGAEAASPALAPRGVTETLRKIVTLESDPKEGAKRLHEMVRAAVEQVNEGSLGRAVTMIELADRIIAESKLDPVLVQQIRERAHESLDQGHLRKLAEEPANHEPLRRVMNFFPALSVPALCDALQTEERRDRRRLILALIEAHGESARPELFERIKRSMETFGDNDSYFQRNLLYLLRRIPPAKDQSWDAELEVVGRMSEAGRPIVLVKEAVANLAQIRYEKAEKVLISRLSEYESLALSGDKAPYPAGETVSLIDRLVYGLARLGTPAALRAAVNHGLKRQPQLGDTTARLAELAGQDLSGDPELVGRLLKALSTELPHKVFGLVIEKSRPRVRHLITALSATPSSAVREALEDVVRRFPETDFTEAAAKVLKGFESVPRREQPEESAVKTLSGDLDLFGLPTLLQNLSQSQAGGLLTLRDKGGTAIGSLIFEDGKLLASRVGSLRGETALYQLLEKPGPGTFVFTSPYDRGSDSAVRAAQPLEVVPLLFEGIRRYDEYLAACALVTDDTTLRATGKKPTRLPDETDRTLLNTLWGRAVGGATAVECEALVAVDAYRVRRMLAHWVEEGALEPV
ncbi:MAG: DUF4388 domain-containing protein [Acidobacteriota bacterium]